MKQSTPETIGRCEWCGLVDHHLVAGQYPRCRERVIDYNPHQVIRQAEAARRQEEARHART